MIHYLGHSNQVNPASPFNASLESRKTFRSVIECEPSPLSHSPPPPHPPSLDEALVRLDDAGLSEHSTALVLCWGSRRVGVGVTLRKDPAEAERTLAHSWD